jgi:hypothetical protein
MVKEFLHYTAWTDAMTYGDGYAGLIGYKNKAPSSLAHILWVIAPNFTSESDAEISADNMLEQILDITRFGKVIYADGVML